MSIIGDLAISPKAVVQGLPATGDSYDHKDSAVQGVMFMNFPVIDVESLKKNNNNINIHSQSGKDLGTMIVAHTEAVPIESEEFFLMASLGKGDMDHWKKICNIKGSDVSHGDVTPLQAPTTYKNTGDLGSYPQREKYRGVKFASFSEIDAKYLINARHPINNHSLSGKKAGSMVIAHDTGRNNIAIMVAAGADRKEVWKKLVDLKGTTQDITPTASDEGTMGKLPLTGDGSVHLIAKEGVYLSTIPCYVDEPFKLEASPENDTKRSGKTLGSMVVLRNSENQNYSLYVASGNKPKDTWVKILDLKNTNNNITPSTPEAP